jgi:tetratricopeptide (TPR) repeat protein
MANTRAARAMAATVAIWAVIGLAGGIGLAQGPATPQPATPQPATVPAPAPATATTSPAVMLEKGIYTEETVGDLDAAIKIYQQIVEDAKAARKYAAQAQYRLGMCYLKKRQSTKAVNCFNELIAAFSDQKELVAKAREQIAKAREGVSDAEIAGIVERAVTDLSTMAESDSRIPSLLQSLREPKESAVVKELTKYLDSDKNTFRRAAIYIVWKGEFSDASPAVPGLVKLCSHEEDLSRGMAAIALGGLKAESAFDKLADMTAGDKSPFSRRAAAYALGLLGKPEAKPILEKALKDPDQFVRNNAEAALTMLAKAGATSPAPPRAIKTTPAAFANDVDPSLDKIIVTFDRPMMDKSWSFTGGGETFPQRVGEISYDAGRTTCTMPVKLQPGKVYWVGVNSPSHKNFKSADGKPAKRYVILFATKSADGKPTPLPEDLVKQAREINVPASQPTTRPKDADKKAAENLSAEGWALWNQRKLPEAEAKFQAAVAKDPTNANAWNGLGWAQMNQGKVLNAKDAFEKAVAADPKLAGALNGLGWIAKGQGKTDEAMRFWRQAVEALPSATAALSGLASTLYEQGQYEKAVEHYQAMLKIEPDSAEAKAGLAKAEMARQAIAAAAPVAQAWLTLVDEGKIAESWEQSSKLFQTGIAKDKWGAVLKSAREPLGKLQSRKLISATYMTSIPGAPDGQYVVIQFEAVFENKKQAVETVTPMKDKDGKWRVSGYYVK